MTVSRAIAACVAVMCGCGVRSSASGDGTEQQREAVVTDGLITGASLPKYTLAFTYDDGPDDHTVELATYLHDQGIRATFFINGCRLIGSPAPISMTNCTLPAHMPQSVLATLKSLGHRIANHTEDHPGLTNIAADVPTVVSQLKLVQPIVDQYVQDGYYLFRPPYGAWDATVAADIRTDPSLDKLTGPVTWDITGANINTYGGDWDCFSHYLATGMSLADTTATCGQFFLDAINARKDAQGNPMNNGVILLHDRQEFSPGTNYPLLLTQWLVARLDRSIYTFVPLDAIPNLPGTKNQKAATLWVSHFSDAEGWGSSRPAYSTIRFADLNNDGYADVCGRKSDGVYCATSNHVNGFTNWKRWSTDFSGSVWDADSTGSTIQLGDINHDQFPDICGRGPSGMVCALSISGTQFAPATLWAPNNGDFTDNNGWGSDIGYYGTIRLGDVNGDHNADVCGRGVAGIYCGLSNGANGFLPITGWKTDDFGNGQQWQPAKYSTTIQLADVDGDGFADVCGRGGLSNGIACALSNHSNGFGSMIWTNFMFTDTDHWGDSRARFGTVRVTKLSDSLRTVCGRNVTGVVCADANSSGTFANYRYVTNSDFADAAGFDQEKYALSIGIADVNGDHKLDVCGRGIAGIWCAVSR
jgi:peptidoglycan/xylan/chitin deacetylase (PgdA/CDA1 family)